MIYGCPRDKTCQGTAHWELSLAATIPEHRLDSSSPWGLGGTCVGIGCIISPCSGHDDCRSVNGSPNNVRTARRRTWHIELIYGVYLLPWTLSVDVMLSLTDIPMEQGPVKSLEETLCIWNGGADWYDHRCATVTPHFSKSRGHEYYGA